MRIFTILLTLFATNYLTAQVFTFNTPSTINPATTTIFSLNVTGLPVNLNETLGLEKICLDITHGDADDLTIWLLAPDGTEVLLTENNGGTDPNYTQTCFVGDTATMIQEGSAPFTGSFRPEQSLSLFNGGNVIANGNWQLKINVNFFRTGILNSFDLTFGSDPVVPPTSQNDECEGAIAIPVNLSYDCDLVLSTFLSNASASSDIDACNFPNSPFDDDIWYHFTAQNPIQAFEFTNFIGSTTELVYEVLEGDCNHLINKFCADGSQNQFEVNNFNTGEKYFLRIASKTTNPSQNINFDICITEGIPPPPSNDECNSAIALTFINQSGTIAGATASSASNSCNGSGNFTNDIWYKFTATATSQQILVSEFEEGTTDDFDFQLNSGQCGNLTQFGQCFFNPQPVTSILIVYDGLSVGNSYTLRIASFDDAPQNTQFKIKLIDPASAPVNNSCESAIELTVSPSGCNFASGTIAGATSSGTPDNCDDFFPQSFDDDVWFKFTPPASDINLNVLNVEGSTPNFIYEVFRGPCSNLATVLCQNTFGEEIELLGLNTNREYFIRIASRDDEIENSSFDIRIESNPLNVCTTESRGPGSLKEAVETALANDVIEFTSSVNGKAIRLDAPTMVLNLPIDFVNVVGSEIILTNEKPSNTAVLLSIQNQIDIEGLRLDGSSNNAMKVEVKNGGELRINN